jgi:hypothetical protein
MVIENWMKNKKVYKIKKLVKKVYKSTHTIIICILYYVSINCFIYEIKKFIKCFIFIYDF